MSALAVAATSTTGALDEDPLMHILLAEDDPRVAEYVTRGFTEAGHVVDALTDGRQAMIQALQGEYDILVLDRMMPGMDGMAMLKSLRASGDRTPAIFLTAVSGVDDRVEGLEAGADDYLTKPFAFSELMARVNALARRPAATTGETTKLAVHDLELDLLSRAARRGDVGIDLQPREFTLLEVLMRNAGRIVSRTNAARAGLGLPLRPEDLGRGDPHLPAAREDRQALRGGPAAHDQEPRLQHEAAALMAASAQAFEAGAAPPSALGGAAPLVVDRDAAPAPCGPWQRLVHFSFARSSLLRNVALRIGLMFWLLFNACLAVAGWGFYTTMQQRVLERTDAALVERLALIESVYETRGLDGLMDIAKGRELLPMHSSMGFHLAAADGSRVAGNVPAPPPADVDGFGIVRGDDVGMPEDSRRYRFLSAPLDGGTLSLGRDLGPLDELRDVAGHCLAYMFAFSTLLALLGAVLISRRLKRRSDGWADALARLAGGTLSERLPVSCARDSIDDMALTVNAALGRLETNVETMRQVSTNIAHDLKTPMNRLWIHLEDAAGEIGAPDTVRLEGALGDALDEAKHVNDTFEALLRVAQIEGGARRTKFRHFDLAEVLRTAAEVYEPVVEDSCDSLVLNLPRASPCRCTATASSCCSSS